MYISWKKVNTSLKNEFSSDCFAPGITFPANSIVLMKTDPYSYFVIFFGQVIISLKSSVHGRLVFVSVNGRQNVVTVLLHTHISLLQSYEIKSPPQAFRWMILTLEKIKTGWVL